MRHYILGAVLAILAGSAAAQTCGGIYRVQPGDSLSVIADGLYKNAGMWSLIHQNNIDKIGKSADSISVGMALTLPCVDGLPTGLEGGEAIVARAAEPATGPVIVEGEGRLTPAINILTGDDYAPFTDRKLPQGGLLAEVMQKAMERAAPAEGFAIHWVNDWDAQINTMLPHGMGDVTFPWSEPPCDLMPEEFRCQNYLFSEPLFEILELVYIDTQRPITFDTDADIEGKTLCRLAGYSVWELDQDGRNWLKDGKIKLERPEKIADCFQMLVDGKVDAVLIDEFAGRASLIEMGLAERVVALKRPIGVEPLNALVTKANPRAADIVASIDAGIASLKASGDYQEIVGRHMAAFWAMP
jgi:polar amino acid transport system substrate-binding protein